MCRNSNTKASQLKRSVRVNFGQTVRVPPARFKQAGPDQVRQGDLAFQGYLVLFWGSHLVLISIVASDRLVE